MGKITKVVVCGQKGVGKTAILEQAIYGKLTKDTFIQSTIEDIYIATIETDRGTKEKIRFYDTGGSDCFANTNLLNLDGYILLFDPCKMDSLDWIIKAKKELDKAKERKEVVVVVLSNHFSPVPDSNVVSKAQTWTLREKLKVYDVSGLERSSLYEAFVYLASRLNPQQVKSTFPQLSMRKKE